MTATAITLPQQKPALWWAFVGLLLSLLFPLSAHAVCTTPDGVAGEQYYNATSTDMEFCDGTNWVPMGNSYGAACATTGLQEYTAGTMQYCDSTGNYIPVDCSTGASCAGTTAGTTRYNASDVEYCDGTNWISTTRNNCALTTCGGFTTGNDTVTCTKFNETINGLAGDDTIYAGAGNDTIYGVSGNDTIYGEAGDDTISYTIAAYVGGDTLIDGGTHITGDKVLFDFTGGISNTVDTWLWGNDIEILDMTNSDATDGITLASASIGVGATFTIDGDAGDAVIDTSAATRGANAGGYAVWVDDTNGNTLNILLGLYYNSVLMD